MAQLQWDQSKAWIHLSRWEKVGALHGDPLVDLSLVVDVKAVDDGWQHVQGFRAPGTGWPSVILLGTMRGFSNAGKWRDFCALYRPGPAIIVTMRNAVFRRWIVAEARAEAVAAELRGAVAPTDGHR